MRRCGQKRVCVVYIRSSRKHEALLMMWYRSSQVDKRGDNLLHYGFWAAFVSPKRSECLWFECSVVNVESLVKSVECCVSNLNKHSVCERGNSYSQAGPFLSSDDVLNLSDADGRTYMTLIDGYTIYTRRIVDAIILTRSSSCGDRLLGQPSIIRVKSVRHPVLDCLQMGKGKLWRTPTSLIGFDFTS